MTFIRVLVMLFGALLLLYAGGCTLNGFYQFAAEWVRTGHGPRGPFFGLFIIIGFATIAVSGLLGWLFVELGRGALTTDTSGLIARIAGYIMLGYVVGFIALAGFAMMNGHVFKPRGDFAEMLPFAVVLALLGWLLVRWGRRF